LNATLFEARKRYCNWWSAYWSVCLALLSLLISSAVNSMNVMIEDAVVVNKKKNKKTAVNPAAPHSLCS